MQPDRHVERGTLISLTPGGPTADVSTGRPRYALTDLVRAPQAGDLDALWRSRAIGGVEPPLRDVIRNRDRDLRGCLRETEQRRVAGGRAIAPAFDQSGVPPPKLGIEVRQDGGLRDAVRRSSTSC